MPLNICTGIVPNICASIVLNICASIVLNICCQHCAQHFTNFHKAHKYLLAKFPMALSAKILPLNLQKKICTHQLAQKAQLREPP